MYRFLEHTADIIIEAKAENKQKTLEDLAKGLFELMAYKKIDKSAKHYHSFELSFDDIGIISFLNNIISFSEEKGLLPVTIEVNDNIAKVGFIEGYNQQVKAVTLHDFVFSENYAKATIDI